MPALGLDAMRPRALRRTARSEIDAWDIFSIACPARALVYIIPELIRPFKSFPPNSGLGLWMSLGLASQNSDRP